MDIVSLRKMTLKSVFSQGEHEGQTVAYVLDTDKSYVQYVYYTVQRITFVDEVLDAAGIREEFRIEKPGVNRDMFYKLRYKEREDYINEGADEEERVRRRMGIAMSVRAKMRNARKSRLIDAERVESRMSSKARLAWRNQGHR